LSRRAEAGAEAVIGRGAADGRLTFSIFLTTQPAQAPSRSAAFY